MPFERFGTSHYLALALVVAGAILFSLAANRMCDRRRRGLELILAGTVGLWEVGWLSWTLWHSDAEGRILLLPFHLCDLSLASALVALAFRPAWAVEFTYYVGLGGSLQALLTPELTADAWSIVCCRFMGMHGLTAAIACYLVFAREYPLGWLSVFRAVCAGYVYLSIAALINLRLGTNYGFICQKPVAGSLLDLMGGWPTYLVWMQGIALFMVLFLHVLVLIVKKLRLASGSTSVA